MDYHWLVEGALGVLMYLLKTQRLETERRLDAVEADARNREVRLQLALTAVAVAEAQASSIGDRLSKVETNIASIQHDVSAIREMLAHMKGKDE